MHTSYEPPKVTVAGSITDLTQASLIGTHLDGSLVLTVGPGGVTLQIPGVS
jgi:hypothetical protein